MSSMNLVRKLVLGIVTIFSLVVLGVSAYWISLAGSSSPSLFTRLALGSSIISVLTLPAMLIIDVATRRSVTSKIAVELSWLGILTVVWIVSAAYTTSMYTAALPVCSSIGPGVIGPVCIQLQAVVGLSHVNWILLFLYLIRLIILSSKSHHGKGVWQMSVKEADFGMEQTDFCVNREFKNSNTV